jgi:hydrogenase expression/formation protein HypD
MTQRMDELSDPRAVRAVVEAVRNRAERLEAPLTLMEVCGTHTHTVAAAGLRRMLPDTVRLLSGPGCPVCVTAVDYLDRAEALSFLDSTVVCTFGDLLRVPSSSGSLEQARAAGGAIELVYSPRDAVELARSSPGYRVILLGIGFETTAPTIAAAALEAEREGLDNLLVLAGNKTMPPALRALLDGEVAIDGFLLPGHVAVVTGSEAFGFLEREYGVGGAVVGFTPTDVLRGVLALVEQRLAGQPAVENLYGRVVRAEGNLHAQSVLEQVLVPGAARWRGLGEIPGSGLELADAWVRRDALQIPVDLPEPREPGGCRCGDVLAGRITPDQCPLFAAGCTPDRPVGACMVSSEGACAAWYRHERAVG